MTRKIISSQTEISKQGDDCLKKDVSICQEVQDLPSVCKLTDLGRLVLAFSKSCTTRSKANMFSESWKRYDGAQYLDVHLGGGVNECS